MRRKELTVRRGFTLTELVVTTVLATIVMLGIGIVLADNQKGWKKMYKRVHTGVVVDAYVARRTFDRIVRQATIRRLLIDGDPDAVTGNTSLRVYYYQNPQTSLELDKYATFRRDGTNLLVDYGDLQPGTWNPQGTPATATLARDVEAVKFSIDGVSVQMILTLDKDGQHMTLTTSAIRHNDWFEE